MTQQPCPCGSAQTYQQCCEPIHLGAPAPTARALMASRYSAYALLNPDYLAYSWHPTTRPPELALDQDQKWTRLRILETTGGQLEDLEGTVHFRAHYQLDGHRDHQEEVSRFTRVDGRWVYLDGDLR